MGVNIQSRNFDQVLDETESFEVVVVENQEFYSVSLQVTAYGDPVDYDIVELLGPDEINTNAGVSRRSMSYALANAGPFGANANPKARNHPQYGPRAGWKITNNAPERRVFRGTLTWTVASGSDA